MKKQLLGFLSGVLFTSVLLVGVYQVGAANLKATIDVIFNDVNLFVDGNKQILDKPAIVYEETTYVPLRKIGEVTGKEVEWNGETNTIYLKEPEKETQKETQKETEPTAVSEVEQLYGKSCAGCHGANLEGKKAPGLLTIGSEMDAAKIKLLIEEGIGTMPAGKLQGEDAEKVANWLAENYK